MNKKAIGIGHSDFKTFIDKNYYYIDKSLFIKDVSESGAQVLLFPRPRRFGKTLNLSMVKYFFEKTETDNDYLFRDLKIWRHEEYRQKQGKYPVIFLTLKDIKQNNWEECYENITIQISKLYKEYLYLLADSNLNKDDKEIFEKIVSRSATSLQFQHSILNLSNFLQKYYKNKTIILIDEYDTPIQAGYVNGYYDKIIDFMRGLLSECFKDNISLEKGILTGILRVAKESIFSGLNKLEVSTLLSYNFNDKFGLLEEEVKEMLKYYEIEEKMNDVKDWYNGYKFGEETIYNPWSIINYVSKYREGLKPYWVNTSSNDLVRNIITASGDDVKKELEQLIAGKIIRKEVKESIVFADINKSSETIWSFLLFSGYLKAERLHQIEEKMYAELSIPNREVLYLYKEIIMNWFQESIYSSKLQLVLKSLITGDVKTFGKVFRDFLLKTMSYFDPTGEEPERVYHAFVLGLLVSLNETHQVKSNRESGYGRYDIMVIPRDASKLGIIIEFKKVEEDENEDLEIAAENALKQIEEKEYDRELIDMGISNILKLGISFSGKKFLIKQPEPQIDAD